MTSRSSGERSLSDGLDVLRAQLSLADVMRLIERTARWVDPETFKLLPVWFPEFARRAYFYKSNWTEPQLNKNRQTGIAEHKREGNTHANKALTHALGLRSDDRPNWSCCHLWGVDDNLYQEANAVVQDRRFFSCVANMVLLPSPLKAFTDVMAEVKVMLRICAANLYGWRCEHDTAERARAELDAWFDWDAYPASWPRSIGSGVPLGVMPINDRIRKSASGRLAAIRHDLDNAGPHYPREEVKAALAYWRIEI